MGISLPSTGSISYTPAGGTLSNPPYGTISTGFSPADFFTGGKNGFWLDFSDLSLLSQNSAGTIPVTEAGDPIGRALDKSPNAVTFSQATSTARPLLSIGGSVYAADFDLSDDALSATVPAMTDATIVLAGTNGIWIDDLTVSAGTFSIGPTTYTGGPAGILALVGNVIGCFVIGRALTSPEQAQIVAYYKAKGAPGVFEVSAANLVTNGTFDIDLSWWGRTDNFTQDSGTALGVSNGTTNHILGSPPIATEVSSHYLLSAELVDKGAINPESIRVRAGTSSGGLQYFELLNTPVGIYNRLFTATSAISFLSFGFGAPTIGCSSRWDNISLRKITLNTGA